MRRFSFLPLLLLVGSSCADGVGEAASGVVIVSMIPGGSVSGGVRFESASLTLDSFDLTPGSDGGGTDDPGHSHGHLTVGETALAMGEGRPDAAALVAQAASKEPVTFDLLGLEQPFRRAAVPSSSFTQVKLRPALASDGEAAGCAFFARGTARIDDDPVPVVVCLRLVEEGLEAIDADFEVGLDEVVLLRLFFAVNELLAGVRIADLDRESDGSILIDDERHPVEAAAIRENLGTAISAIAAHDA